MLSNEFRVTILYTSIRIVHPLEVNLTQVARFLAIFLHVLHIFFYAVVACCPARTRLSHIRIVFTFAT